MPSLYIIIDLIILTILRGKFLSIFYFNSSLCCKITFIADQYHYSILQGMNFKFCNPFFQIIKTFLISYVIYQKCSYRIPIICACQCSVSLLTSSIPYLRFYQLSLNLKTLGLKLHSYCRLVVFEKLILDKSRK